MKNLKLHIGIIGTLLFILVIVFTNDRMKERIPYALDILAIVYLAFFALAIFTILYVGTPKEVENKDDVKSIKALLLTRMKINKEFQKIDDQATSTVMGKNSILISIFLLFYSFTFVGSSLKSNFYFIDILCSIIRILFILYGAYLLYLNAYMTFLQLKLNKKWSGYVAIVFNILSILYFLFVSWATLTEMLKPIFYVK